MFARSGSFGSGGGPLLDRILKNSKGEGLPGAEGVQLTGRPTVSELQELTRLHQVEFAVVYRLGSGPNGSGGSYWLYSGSYTKVRIPQASDVIAVYHTHPGLNSAVASKSDLFLLRTLQSRGSPQKSSIIVPEFGQPRRWGGKYGTGKK